jgi:hypothetical protein
MDNFWMYYSPITIPQWCCIGSTKYYLAQKSSFLQELNWYLTGMAARTPYVADIAVPSQLVTFWMHYEAIHAQLHLSSWRQLPNKPLHVSEPRPESDDGFSTMDSSCRWKRQIDNSRLIPAARAWYRDIGDSHGGVPGNESLVELQTATATTQ